MERVEVFRCRQHSSEKREREREKDGSRRMNDVVGIGKSAREALAHACTGSRLGSLEDPLSINLDSV